MHTIRLTFERKLNDRSIETKEKSYIVDTRYGVTNTHHIPYTSNEGGRKKEKNGKNRR